MFIIIITLTLIGVVSFVVITYFTKDTTGAPSEPTIDEIVALTYDTTELTTNLLSNDFAKVQFRVQVDNKKALEEIEKRDFQLENIIIRELAELKASELQGSEAIGDLEETLKTRINELMENGEVVHVYTRRFIIQ